MAKTAKQAASTWIQQKFGKASSAGFEGHKEAFLAGAAYERKKLEKRADEIGASYQGILGDRIPFSVQIRDQK